MTKYSKTETAEARERLEKLIKPGTKIYTTVKHVSRSGMMRVISAHVIDEDREPRDVSRDVAVVIGGSFDRDRWGVKMGGAGMDMTFALTYNLSRALFPNGFTCTGSDGWTPTGKRSKIPACRSNDHSNGEPRKRGMKHRDGGYALINDHF